MSEEIIRLHYDINDEDFSAAGEASSGVKKTLSALGVSPETVKKVAIAMYEAEINVHALDQTLRQVNIQFIIDRADFEKAQQVLHKEFVEKD